MTAAGRAIRLGGTGLETTTLGFGCADLYRQPSRTARQRLLEAAFDVGIRHFDVAPMYGLGLVESEVGRFARGRRDEMVIATKFGIEPTLAGRLIARAQPHIQRAVAARSPNGKRARPAGLDPRLGLVGRLLYDGGDYGPSAARSSLERSLRALQTDYVDVFFLHDPMSGTVKSDDVRGCLEQARAAGRIRAWGVAGETGPALEAVQWIGAPVPVLQVRGDMISRALCPIPAESASAVVLFGVIGRALTRILAHLGDERVRRRWTDAVGVDCASVDALASLLLADAVRANARGPVLFSTTRVDRIARAAAAPHAPNGSAVDALRALVAAEIVPAGAIS